MSLSQAMNIRKTADNLIPCSFQEFFVVFHTRVEEQKLVLSSAYPECGKCFEF